MKDNEDNTEIPKVYGDIHISYSVDCPHCKAYLDDYYDRDWWNKSIELSEGMDVQTTVECPKCNKEFYIEEFVY